MFEISMGELQQVILLFTESDADKGVKEILDDDLYRKKYSKVNIRKLIMILEKFREEKVGVVENKETEALLKRAPKVKKSDCQMVSKKLRESFNISK
mmetsp:Transcript_17111/g.16335  ORF Transcript_17111/g.16335 Transcript_17111/m.16335 type:complete len:97 (+) Transcript_17111:1500-1790(+)